MKIRISLESKKWLKWGKISLFERASVLLFGVVGFVVLVRIFSKEVYGVWILYLTIVNLLDISRNGFFMNPLIRFLNLDIENKEELKVTSFSLNLIFSTIIALLLFVLSFYLSVIWENEAVVTLFGIHIFTNIFLTFLFHGEYLSKAKMQYLAPAVAYFLKGFIFVGGILFYFLGEIELTLEALGLLYSGAALISAISIYLFVRDDFKIILGYNKGWARKLIGYGKYTFGTNAGAVIQRNIDVWMISFYISPAASAIYNIAIRITNLFELPLMAIASILYPQAVIKANEEGVKAFRGMYEKSVAIILIFVVPLIIVVLIFAEEVVYLLAGEGYEQSVDILRVTMLYGLILPFHKQMGILFDAIGKAKVNTIFTLRNAIINTILNAIAIPYLGIMGAAYATFTTFFSMMIYNLWYLHKHYDVSLRTIIHYIFFFGKKIIQRKDFN